ncbi:hypothetical protein [Herbiconiux daphne]|uniref:Uncharacterized protein n=1 Tax=Herbiconiux daphne TaxID=2970914 RepID=A0ABT2GX01_9MICO|nr:hypothetical protein [Herbiconiux daphne]MCS5732482.1 hypothetical protein [Herbiconiux daphne]
MKTHPGRVEVVAVPSAGWRLRDRSRRISDPSGLLGFVEADEKGRFHTVWLCPSLATEDFTSLDEAIRAATDHCAARTGHG